MVGLASLLSKPRRFATPIPRSDSSTHPPHLGSELGSVVLFWRLELVPPASYVVYICLIVPSICLGRPGGVSVSRFHFSRKHPCRRS